jgi:hypothetical protein
MCIFHDGIVQLDKVLKLANLRRSKNYLMESNKKDMDK